MTKYSRTQSDRERHFCSVGLDSILLTQNLAGLKAALNAAVWECKEYQNLPATSRAYVAAYLQGAADIAARLLDTAAAQVVERNDGVERPPNVLVKLQPDVKWHRHANGGGWVSETAYVEASASVSGRAAVFGNARVLDRARIYGSARVGGNAECFGAPHIHEKAFVGGNAKVYDAARVRGEAQVYGYVQIGGTSVVRGTLVLDGAQIIMDELITNRDAARSSNANRSDKSRSS